ncbi:phosphoenolpyruvate--protein phosphotransferase [Marinivivus vitaminiproducens]|uniref:phosphoenolpyruvate--protein phosphotransferase n=1 Tax=Marinivivus vitaminiproducens TaxID=3035935 RepID=UPI0027A6CFFC|nr:phosphoenolpyruvate--protein phosphotransferase [Geminicoccaceae bacterium SCSIO 64248]
MAIPVDGRGGGASPAGPERRPSEFTPARRLLRRLVEIMALPIMWQERLDRLVGLVASDLVAEVCSVYARRPGDILELFSSQGLNLTAVHLTRLRVGEGLVGQVALDGEVVNVSDAKQDPRFAYRPETGEEAYSSLLGAPIVRDGQIIGVVVVQNQAKRVYAEDEVEALQIVATLLAEVLASNPDLSRERISAPASPIRLEGVRLSDGAAIAEALPHRTGIKVTRVVADDPEVEVRRLDKAIASLRASVDAMLALPEIDTGEQREVLEAYRMFARDAGWLRRMREVIQTGLSAEAAVKQVQDQTRLRMAHLTDDYLRERLLDLVDLADRLLLILTGGMSPAQAEDLPESFIVIARSLGPAELLDFDRKRLAGIVLEEGSPTAHVTILARALGIPMLGRVESALVHVERGDLIALDGQNGLVYVRPSEDVEQAMRLSLDARAARKRAFAGLRHEPSVTRDGVSIRLMLNAAFLIDIDHLEAVNADGIGLYRTELGFMVRDRYPDVHEQEKTYAAVMDAANGKPVTFRTLDVGSDKLLPYWKVPREENPAMGWRAIRLSLDRPAMLRDQLRALVRAAAGRPLRIMFPMIAEVAELDAALAVLDRELDRTRKAGLPVPEPLQVGAMLEVPALYWQLPALLKRVDFISVGSNDLGQFLFACDRGNPELIGRYDALSPAFLTFLRDLVLRCRTAGVELSLCGEMASRPLEAMTLIGLGFRNLSLMPGDFDAVKAVVRSVTCGGLASYLDRLYELPVHSLRASLREYGMDHGVYLNASSIPLP